MGKKVADDIVFDGQHDGERVIIVFRRHILSMRRGFYELLVPLLVTSIPPLIWQEDLRLFLLPLLGFILGLILFLYRLMQWYYTIFILTNERLRQITQRGFFGRDVVELPLSKIQNISYNIPGFTGEVLRYGTIIIQTFVGDLVINKVENPSKIFNSLQDAVYVVSKYADKQDEEVM